MIVPSLLPDRRTLFGPVTSRRMLRTGAVYALVFSLGLAIAQLADGAQWKAFGLGLMWPGGGFLAHADPAGWHGAAHLLLAGFALAAFVAALFLWLATGNALAPPAVWLSAALAAASMNHGEVSNGATWLLPALLLGAIAAGVAAATLWQAAAVARRQAANRYLATAGGELAKTFARTETTRAEEFSPDDLKLLRFVLDRALQPLPSFNGFEWLDQYQTAAVRYQLNFMGYALSMAQATRLPAFGGYLDEAQRRLIEKQTDHRVWRYWEAENRWGNLAQDPNPVARDNIMFTGFCAAQIAMFQAASGRRDYDEADSFNFRHPSGKRFYSDFGALVATLERESRQSGFGLIPCEPNWIYPLCNTIGAAAMKAREMQSGGMPWSSYEDLFRRRLEAEFTDLSGRFVSCRSTYTGLALPAIGGAPPQAMASFFLNATMPDLALRHWLLLRRNLLDENQALQLSCFWPIDTGNYRFSRAAAFAGTALAAVEMGDEQVAALCLAELAQRYPPAPGAESFYRLDASVWAHAVELLARSGAHNGLRHLIGKPDAVRTGPMICDVRYPDVLVARAVAQDGMLDAVLYPGKRNGRHRVGLSGLAPGAVYACDGAEEPRIVADAQGRTTLIVCLDGRRALRVRPS
jgi:hypothetical protein